MVSAQIEKRAERPGFSLLTIKSIETDVGTEANRVPVEVVYRVLCSPTPTVEEILREYYLLDCD